MCTVCICANVVGTIPSVPVAVRWRRSFCLQFVHDGCHEMLNNPKGPAGWGQYAEKEPPDVDEHVFNIVRPGMAHTTVCEILFKYIRYQTVRTGRQNGVVASVHQYKSKILS